MASTSASTAAPGPKGGEAGAVDAPRVDLKAKQTNLMQLQNMRTWASLVFGAACGVLGVEGWIGLAGYPLSQAALFLLLYVRTQGKLAEFFESTREAALSMVLSGLMTYTFFWTVCHNLVHLF